MAAIAAALPVGTAPAAIGVDVEVDVPVFFPEPLSRRGLPFVVGVFVAGSTDLPVALPLALAALPLPLPLAPDARGSGVPLGVPALDDTLGVPRLLGVSDVPVSPRSFRFRVSTLLFRGLPSFRVFTSFSSGSGATSSSIFSGSADLPALPAFSLFGLLSDTISAFAGRVPFFSGLSWALLDSITGSSDSMRLLLILSTNFCDFAAGTIGGDSLAGKAAGEGAFTAGEGDAAGAGAAVSGGTGGDAGGEDAWGAVSTGAV